MPQLGDPAGQYLACSVDPNGSRLPRLQEPEVTFEDLGDRLHLGDIAKIKQSPIGHLFPGTGMDFQNPSRGEVADLG